MERTSPEAVGLSTQRMRRIDALMQEYIDRQKIAGVITVVARRGQVAHFESYGWMNLETNQLMQPDTLVRVASMSKLITTVAVLMLYEEGRFELDDPVAHFIPEVAAMKVCREATSAGLQLVEQERAMTIRDLLMHTAGFVRGTPAGSPVELLYHQAELDSNSRSLQEMVQALVSLPLASQPGSHWNYGLTYNVLSHLVELIGGMPFDTFLQQRIFDPFGMHDTSFWAPPEKLGRLAAVYGLGEDQSLVRVDTPDVNRFAQPRRLLDGAGGLVSTATDYLRFAQMLLNGGEADGTRLLGRKTVELMTRNHMPDSLLPSYQASPARLAYVKRGHGYGLGVRVLKDVAQSGILGSEGEYGWLGAFNTFVWIDPKEEMICLLLSQFTPNLHYPIDRQFKVLAYQAIVD